jgi:hypothetical protein
MVKIMDELGFQSSKLLLDTVKKEYNLENEKGKNFDVRGGILVPLYSALLIFMITGVLSNGITGDKANGLLPCVVYFLYFISTILSVLGILYATWCLIKMFAVSEYNRINFDDLVYEIDMDEDRYAYFLYNFYENALMFNREINKDKIVYLQRSVMMFKYVVICICFSYLFLVAIRVVGRGGGHNDSANNRNNGKGISKEN